MKRTNGILLAVLLAATLTACGGGDGEKTTEAVTTAATEAPTTAAPTTEALTTEAPTTEEEKSDSPINFENSGGNTLTFTKFEVVQDYEGKPALAVYFDFSNNGEEAKAGMFEFSVTAFQNGVECSTAIVSSSSAEFENSMKEIKSGVKLPVCWYFSLSDTTSDVELEVTDLISFDDKAATQILKLSDGTDAAGESASQESAAGEEVQAASAQPAVEGGINFKDSDGSTVVYTKHEVVKDYEGNPALAVYFDYTNNSDKAQASMYILSIKAFQNGVECESAMLTSPAEEYGNTLKEVKKGVTLPICWYFKLSDTTAEVEVEVSPLIDFSGDNKETQIIKLQ